MKKLLVLALILGSMAITVPSIEAKTTTLTSAPAPQIKVRIGGRQRNRGVRTVTRTRVVRTRYGAFREVYRITYLPNGRTRTQVISRTRIRR